MLILTETKSREYLQGVVDTLRHIMTQHMYKPDSHLDLLQLKADAENRLMQAKKSG